MTMTAPERAILDDFLTFLTWAAGFVIVMLILWLMDWLGRRDQ